MSTQQVRFGRNVFVCLIAAGGIASTILPPVVAKNAYQNPPACTRVQSRFGRLFSSLSAARWPAADVDLLAGKVMAEEETAETPEGVADAEENNDIDAGFTYVGQFIDHDLTLDQRPNDLTTPADPFSLQNFRTPAFDLDNVYGDGPLGSAYLYEADSIHLKLGLPLSGAGTDGGAVDLPRNATGQALIRDPRDDENRIIASLHTIVRRFHNLWVDRLALEHRDWSSTRVFAEAQRQVRLHYQWAVLTDFLPTIVGKPTLAAVLPSTHAPHLTFYNPCIMNMPVEFSVAAYRFGHSLVRPIYRINTAVVNRLPVFSLADDPTRDLGGFRPSPANFAIDWAFLLPLEGQRVIGKPQASYKIDNSLVFPLGLLPLPETGAGPASLARRNLLRSMQLGLPSGQDVARAMGVKPLRDDQILIGKAVEPEAGQEAESQPITGIARSFAGKAPLWTYILAEATAGAFNIRDGHIVGRQIAPMRLGRVGGRIVAEIFVGLMLVDRSSILYTPSFRPDPAFAEAGRFGFRELILAVIGK